MLRCQRVPSSSLFQEKRERLGKGEKKECEALLWKEKRSPANIEWVELPKKETITQKGKERLLLSRERGWFQN